MLVVLEVLNSLLKSGILEVECFLLKLQIKQLLLGLEQVLLQLVSVSLTFIEFLFEVTDFHLSRKLKSFSLLNCSERLANKTVVLVLNSREVILGFSELLLELVFLSGESAHFGLESDFNGLAQLGVFFLLCIKLVTQLGELL
jgi:hypothetical protein